MPSRKRSLVEFWLYAFSLFWKTRRVVITDMNSSIIVFRTDVHQSCNPLGSFNPLNVAELKIDYVGIDALWSSLDLIFFRTVQPYQLLYRPKTVHINWLFLVLSSIAKPTVIPRSFIFCRVKGATSKTTKDLSRMFIIPRYFIHCRAKRACWYSRLPVIADNFGRKFWVSSGESP